MSAASISAPRRLAGDTVYGAVRLLKWLVDRNITPHVPVWDKSTRPDGTFSRADFVFDQERNIYVCPGGAELTSTGKIDQGHIVYYRASKSDCSQERPSASVSLIAFAPWFRNAGDTARKGWS